MPMADTLHRQERQEHMKSTIDSFNGRKQRGVLKFLLLDAENAPPRATARSCTRLWSTRTAR